jgi:hypothetical protein
MLKPVLIEIYKRDLAKLKAEIEAYKTETDLWKIDKGISNSAGNLCLHLIGNLNHFIGAGIGNTGYVRNRDKEFADKNIPKAQLLADIEKTTTLVEVTIANLSEADLANTYPGPKTPFGDVSTTYFLVHLLAHLNYHLGQINYHRRLLEAR